MGAIDMLGQILTRGQRVVAHGREFILVEALGDHLYFAVKPDATFPAEIFLVKYEGKVSEPLTRA